MSRDGSLPDGVELHDIPGCRPVDERWDGLLEQVPATCPGCGFNCWPAKGEPQGEYGLAAHIRVHEDGHSVTITCVRENVTASRRPGHRNVVASESTECETVLVDASCRCRQCEPPEDDE
jgi:hypothetical protein